MSKIQPPVSDSEVPGHAANRWMPLDPKHVIDDSLTPGMILRRTKLLEDFSDLNISQSRAEPIKGNSRRCNDATVDSRCPYSRYGFARPKKSINQLQDSHPSFELLSDGPVSSLTELESRPPEAKPTIHIFDNDSISFPHYITDLFGSRSLNAPSPLFSCGAAFVSHVSVAVNKFMKRNLWFFVKWMLILPKTNVRERCNNELALTKTMSEIDYLKALKYGVYNASEVKDELDGIDVKNLNCTIYKIKKLDADRKCVNKVIVETYMGLARSFTFDPLVSYISSIEELDRYRTNLVEEENKNKMLRKEMSRQVRQQRNHIKTVLYDTDVIIDKLRTQVEDSVLYAEVSSRYTDNWQKARTEQHMQTIFNIENKPLTNIEFYKQRTDHELRVHTEVETLVTISITETLAKIEKWMEKFEKDMERIDLKIQMKKIQYQDKRDKNIQYEETLERHDVKMKNWVQFKNEREVARAYHEKMLNSAIIVQAWWRGLLVRLCLGPYRVKKQKKEKKKP